jgi:hypothetical protein
MRRSFNPFSTLCLLLTMPAAAQVPAEVSDLRWCPGTQDCLQWSAVADAATYNVYGGGGDQLAGLTDGSVDSCTAGTFVGTTTGPMPGTPAPGQLDWFLVTAANPLGEGSAGSGAAGLRVVDSAGPCSVGGGGVINEVDYDQPGTDSAEFVEIHASVDLDLTSLALIFVNGLTQAEYDRVELSDAGPVLGAGSFLVVGSPEVIATLPAGTLSIALGATNNLQNGSPDGIALFDTSTSTLLDALSYEGAITAATFDGVPGTFNLVEGVAASAQDSNSATGSLVRFRDGSDSDQADADWQFATVPTPGAANAAP